jgi:methylmalonyl-CoA mutase
MTMNGAVLPIMAFYIVAGEEQGVPREQLTGTIQNDILKEFAVRNTYIYPPEPSMRIVSDIIAYCARDAEVQLDLDQRLSHARGRSDGGAGACLHARRRHGICPRGAMAKGLDIDAFAPRLSFFFGIGMNLFMEVAKLRAARTLWARIMTELAPSRRSRSCCARTARPAACR